MTGQVGHKRGRLQILAMLLICAADAHATSPVTGDNFDPVSGFRISSYRAPLPEVAPGATRIFAADLLALLKEKRAVLIDVMAAEGGGFDEVTGEWRLIKTHDHIPGSTWLPDVGKGRIDDLLDRYFQSNLTRLTEGDKARAIVIYCQSDCWMSWNAVRRAAAYGYHQIYWLPEGVDGWTDWDGPVTPAVPEPVRP